jgi:hypothetical protein
MISGSPINVVDYGFSTTANAATNKAALLAAIAAGGEGSLIVIPNGTFEIDGEIQINKKGVTIQGEASNYRYSIDTGFTGTELKFMSGVTGFDLTNTDSVYATSSEYSVLRNININGNSILENAVYIKGLKLIQNCTIQKAINGIRLGGFVNQTIIEKCGIVANTTGVLVDGIANTIFKITECNIRTNTVGVKIENDSGGNFEQCAIESNSAQGLIISAPAASLIGNIKFYNCWFENNGFGVPTQQVLIQGADANPDISFITFDYCTFDALSNTTNQDCYLDGGNYTRFTRCKFTNLVATGIVITTKCTFTSFFNCQRGVQVGVPLASISDSGYATYIQPSPQTYVGPNLVAASTWTNGTYSTFTSTGNKITSAICSGAATATLSTITRSKGVSYAMQIYITVLSGQAPTIVLTNGNNTVPIINSVVSSGSAFNIYYYTETITGSSGVLTMSNLAASSWKMEANLIEYEVVRGYIDINAG